MGLFSVHKNNILAVETQYTRLFSLMCGKKWSNPDKVRRTSPWLHFLHGNHKGNHIKSFQQ
jgi:hypothetical protein